MSAVREAYSTRNVNAFVQLRCWDGVSQERRSDYVRIFVEQLKEERHIESVRYTGPQVSHSLTNNGIAYVPNLTPVKWIRIQFAPGPHSRRALELEIGEKKGKLMLVSYIPQKP